MKFLALLSQLMLRNTLPNRPNMYMSNNNDLSENRNPDPDAENRSLHRVRTISSLQNDLLTLTNVRPNAAKPFWQVGNRLSRNQNENPSPSSAVVIATTNFSHEATLFCAATNIPPTAQNKSDAPQHSTPGYSAMPPASKPSVPLVEEIRSG